MGESPFPVAADREDRQPGSLVQHRNALFASLFPWVTDFVGRNFMPLVAMHWEHRFNHMVNRYNEIYRVQMPNITPHVCRHTYCSNQAKAGMNPKTLQYLMGHSDIGVTLNVYTHLGLEDAAAEMARIEEVETARKEQEKISGKKDRENKVTQKMFRAV